MHYYDFGNNTILVLVFLHCNFTSNDFLIYFLFFLLVADKIKVRRRQDATLLIETYCL